MTTAIHTPSPTRTAKGTAKRHDDAKAYAFGERLSLVEWSQRVGVSAKILSERMIGGLTAEQAIAMPAKQATGRTAEQRAHIKSELQAIATECGVTRQAIEQTQARALGRFRRSLIAAACIAWTGELGETLTDDEIADIIVAIADDEDLRRALFASDLDVAPLCEATLMLRGKEAA